MSNLTPTQSLRAVPSPLHVLPLEDRIVYPGYRISVPVSERVADFFEDLLENEPRLFVVCLLRTSEESKEYAKVGTVARIGQRTITKTKSVDTCTL